MEKTSIVFSKASTFFPIFSWLIMATEGTPYSHVAIKMIDDETNQVIYYQASHTLVNEMSEAQFLSQEKVVYSFDFQISPEVKKAAKTFAIDNLGKPYGVLSCVGLGLVQVCKWFGIKIHNPFRDAGATYICDQFIAALLVAVQNITLPMNINDMTPKDLYPVIANLPKVLQ